MPRPLPPKLLADVCWMFKTTVKFPVLHFERRVHRPVSAAVCGLSRALSTHFPMDDRTRPPSHVLATQRPFDSVWRGPHSRGQIRPSCLSSSFSVFALTGSSGTASLAYRAKRSSAALLLRPHTPSTAPGLHPASASNLWIFCGQIGDGFGFHIHTRLQHRNLLFFALCRICRHHLDSFGIFRSLLQKPGQICK